ncbi:WhiB family transcriptional regulator [Streptomyces sp. SID9944]|nr:WhiB family transcriptional regulator [Streptomyces sp. SID9944]
MCHGCPVRQRCGEWALDTREGWGVWGGMTEAQRTAILRRRRAPRTGTSKVAA